jgi:hypothetical protein
MEFLRISFGSLFQTRLDLTKYDLAYVDVRYSCSSNAMMPSVLLPDLVDLLVFFTFGTMLLRYCTSRSPSDFRETDLIQV